MSEQYIINNNPLAVKVKEKIEAKFVKKGLGLGLMSGITWGLHGVILGIVLSKSPFTNSSAVFIAPLAGAALNDSFSGIWLLIYNIFTGRGKEVFRSLKTFPGMMICIAALLGGPVAMGSYLLSIQFSGAAYAMGISAIFPVIGAILARIFLKEKITPRVWIGIIACVAGAVLIGYIKPEGQLSSNFYLGIIFALIAAFGWGAEGVLSTYGMSMVDPTVAINIRQATSGIIFIIVILPAVSGLSLLGEVIKTPDTLFGLLLLGLLGAYSFLCWYKSFEKCGVAKGMALNATYALFGVIFSYIITKFPITPNLVAGAVIVTMGVILVVADPREMFNLGTEV